MFDSGHSNKKQQNNTMSNVILVDEHQNDLNLKLFHVRHLNDKVKMLQMLNVRLFDVRKYQIQGQIQMEIKIEVKVKIKFT